MGEARSTVPAGFRRAAQAAVVGASAGGIEVLLEIVGQYEPGRPPLVIALHVAESAGSLLESVFATRARMRVREPEDKEPLAPGTIYFAPAGYHLQIEDDRTFSLSCDPAVHFSRPSIDVLMESAACALGAEGVGILLTGANEDGAAGLARMAACGALTAVQDPAEAAFPQMPAAALRAFTPDFVLPSRSIPDLLNRLMLP